VARLDEERAKQLDLRRMPHDRDRWLTVMVANPILIERPILVADGGRAVLGRPPEAIEALL
jgi:arsenate reductase